MRITASTLYDYIQCQHKVWRDIYGPQDEKIKEINPFVELLWQKGVKHEQNVVACLGDFLDMREGSVEQRFQRTLQAMRDGVTLIYQGVLKHENLLGIPDLLQRQKNGTYMPVDIKSGMGYEGADEETGEEGKLKKHYAVQLCLYSDILRKLGFAARNKGKILDIRSEEVEYDLVSPMGIKNRTTWWEYYETIKEKVDLLMRNVDANKPALGGVCKLCAWHDSCKSWCEEARDLTNIFYLGRTVRDTINSDLSIERVEELLGIDVSAAVKMKKQNKAYLRGIAEKSLSKYITRARIIHEIRKPVAHTPVVLPTAGWELFFDIEDDPTQDVVYLHGVFERCKGKGRFISFVAKDVSQQAEKEAWQSFWEYINSLPRGNFAVYYYSHHEKTTYKRLQKRYPDVISMEKVDEFFDSPNVIDLYKVVQQQTDWPTCSYSLKTLASYLGFKWRDETPSGALSIQWFNEYLEKKDEKLLQRILEYNEDDCKATMVLRDALLTI